MMTRSDFRRQLQEGLNTVFGIEYDRHSEEWSQIFDVEHSNKAYEEDVLMYGLGAAPVKYESEALAYDEGGESYSARYQHETIALGFAISEEAEEDGLYGSLGNKLSRGLARSLQHTKEVKGANILNNGYDTNYTGGDGVPLFSTSHPLAGGGVLANKLSTPADLSEASLEELLNLIGDWSDDRGIPVRAQAVKLIVPTELQFVATRLLYSQYQTDTGDNNISAIYKLGSIRDGHTVNHRLTDPDAWFVKTDIPDGLKHFVRKAVSGGVEGDFDTGTVRFKKRERYSFGWTDWRGAAGSEGADA